MAWLSPSPKTIRALKKTGKMKRNIQIQWYAEGGRIQKKSTGTKDLREAQRILALFQQQLEEQTKHGFHRTLFSEAAEELIKSRQLAERTIKRYRSLSESFLEYAGASIMVHEIDAGLADDFRIWAREPVTRTRRSGEVVTEPRFSDKTQNMVLAFVRAVLKHSHKKGYVVEDISQDITGIPRTKVRQKPVRAFTADELKAIFSEELDPDIKLCFRGLLHLGVRRGELASINWDKVDFKNRTVRVFGQKTNKWRTIPICDALLPLLEAEKQRAGSRPHVFCRPGGEAADKHLYRHLMRACRNAGINTQGLTLHSFRHTFIQNLLQAGVNFKTIMSWSGHQDLKSFMIYLEQYQPVPDDINKARYDFLDGL